ncbi:MAG TPA: NAD(P)-dependent alcohol dehydrogenase, partial [Bryobacteraceae bacterium]|nr:NAD(P)-dependent alcohol dehydrogenase [Bryobacteraceae bacterium]
VLCLGTGGVSIFALQFARAAGARVLVTSSSSEKIRRAVELGAAGGIDYKAHPDWEKEVLARTGGRGVDHIIEVGGAGTLSRSFQAVAFGGKVALIGLLAPSSDINPYPLMMKSAAMQGIGVGTRAMFEEMNAAIEANRIRPVVDRVFPFDQAAEAYRYHASGNFVGKVVIAL